MPPVARHLKFLYTTPLLVAAYRQRSAFGAANRIGLTPTLLGEDAWKPADRMIARIRRTLEEDIDANALPVLLLQGIPKAWIERQGADMVTPWARVENPNITRLALPLETNPLAMAIFAASVERVHMEAGNLWWINAQTWHSFANLGAHPTVTLFVDFEVEEVKP